MQGRSPPRGVEDARLQQLAFPGKPGFIHGVPSLLVFRAVKRLALRGVTLVVTLVQFSLIILQVKMNLAGETPTLCEGVTA